MSRTSRNLIAAALSCLTCILLPWGAWASQAGPGARPAAAAAERGLPLKNFLNPDGTLNLPATGIAGSIDPSGFRLASGPGEKLRFVPGSGGAAAWKPEAAGDEYWASGFVLHGLSGGWVEALLWDGTNLYAGGGFTSAGGGQSMNHIARWDGTDWNALGSGTNGTVYALAWDGTYLYAGGAFTMAGEASANNVAKWDGTAWSALGSGLNGAVHALLWEGTAGALYVGGEFTATGDNGTELEHVARWSGGAWSDIGGGVNDSVFSLAWDATHQYFYAGGIFGNAGAPVAIPAAGIAMWDGTYWHDVGGGSNGAVNTLLWDGTALYAGGAFAQMGGSDVGFVAKWDGTSWSKLGSGLNGFCWRLVTDGTNFYADGTLTDASGTPATYIAKWDGTNWSALGAGLSAWGHSLAWDGTSLYAGGQFDGVVRWNGSLWSTVPLPGPGMGDTVYALAWDGTYLYAGGAFTTAGGVANTSHVARWDGTAWSALGAGFDNTVYALAWTGTYLYAGGSFTHTGSVTLPRIAKWDGASWTYLFRGLNDTVYALLWDPANQVLYAGGSFTRLGSPRDAYGSHVAKWNGTTWSVLPAGATLGGGVNADVRALAWDPASQTLYAGGLFTTAYGGVTANRVASFNGSAWSALGTGMETDVYALAWNGTTLYAGGAFTTADGNPAEHIAGWNGSAWSPVGSGMDDEVRALVWDGADLYTGGAFATAGGNPASRAARWDGSAWTALGSGTNATVFSFVWDGIGLYAGGSFTTAGTKESDYIGRWNPPLLSKPTGMAASMDECQETVSWLPVTGATRYDVLRGDACGTSSAAFTDVASPFGDATAVPGTPYEYWVVPRSPWRTGPASDCAQGRMATLAPPALDSPPDAQSSCSGDPTFYWEPSTCASTYTVFLDGSPVVGCQDITGTQCGASGLADGATYTWKVRAYRGADMVESPERTFTTNTHGIPLDLSNDLLVTQSPGGPTLDWSLMGTPGPQTDHYQVYRAASAGAPFPSAWTLVGDVPLGTQTYTDSDAPEGSLWFYDVRSANGCDNPCPRPLSVWASSDSPSCDGSGTVRFAAQASGGAQPFTYDWDFGDGSTHGTGAAPTHTYSYPPYTRSVTLTVTDSSSGTPQTGTSTFPIALGTGDLADSPTQDGPKAVGEPVSFTSSPTGGVPPYTYRWDFGDGSGVSTDQNPSHAYAAAGTMSVTVEVTDASGCSVSTPLTVQINTP